VREAIAEISFDDVKGCNAAKLLRYSNYQLG
jgi:hypothetical protein